MAHWLWRAATRHPENPALLVGADCVATYADFAKRAAAIGCGLRASYNVGDGDRVAIFLPNSVEYLPILFGIWAAGGVVVPINAKLHLREVAWIVQDSGARIAIMDGPAATAYEEIAGRRPASDCEIVTPRAIGLLADGEALLQPIDRDHHDLAWLFYTSGTTGRPKGVMLSNGNLQAMAFAYITDVDDPEPGCATIYAAPLSHGAGLYSVVHVLRGAAHVVPSSGGFDPEELLGLGRRLERASLFAAPTMVRRLVEHARMAGADGEGLETIIYGGGPMYTADIEAAVALLGPRFVQIYGQGESPMTITILDRETVADRSHPRWHERLGSVGVAASCAEIRIGDSSGRALPSGVVGEVLVRGPQVMLGYWNDEEATKRTLKDGWLWTGDMGVLDDDGYLVLKDRSKDVIISGGANIYPREVEEAILTCADVSEVCVLGRPNDDWGEEVVAFVVPRPGAKLSTEALDHHCTGEIARFKRPKHYWFVNDLPKNSYGKVLKTALREQLTHDSGDQRVS